MTWPVKAMLALLLSASSAGCLGQCVSNCSTAVYVDSDLDGFGDSVDPSPLQADLVVRWHARPTLGFLVNDTLASIVEYFEGSPYRSPGGRGINVTFETGAPVVGDLSSFINNTARVPPSASDAPRNARVHVYLEQSDRVPYCPQLAPGCAINPWNVIVIGAGYLSGRDFGGNFSWVSTDQSWARWIFMHELEHLLWPTIPPEYQRPDDPTHTTTMDPIGFSTHDEWKFSDAFWYEKAGQPLFPALTAFNEHKEDAGEPGRRV